MPTYEFRCPAGHEFEKFYRSIGIAPTEVRCPTCGKIGARQMSAGAGLVFKGSGFYITDYGKDGKKQQVAPTAAGEADTKGGESAPPKPESTGAGDAAAPAGTGATPATGKSKAAGGAKPATAPAKKPKTDE